MAHKNFEVGNFIQEQTQEIFDFFAPVEGFNTVYYGKIGNGKTRNATADIIELCNRGEIVYANWHVNVPDFDERSSFRHVWAKFLGGRNYFYHFKKENFRYFDPQELIDNNGEVSIAFLARLVGVHLFLDEGQWILNSMERYNPDDPFMVAKLKLVLHGRHYCRSLNVITQRPSNISKNVRAQVSIWYRCVKKFDMFGFMVFQRWAIQDMKDDLPVEFIDKKDKEGKVIREVPNGDLKTYWVNKRTDKVFPAYNTHAMRGRDAIEEMPRFDAYYFGPKARFFLLLRHVIPARILPAIIAGKRRAVALYKVIRPYGDIVVFERPARLLPPYKKGLHTLSRSRDKVGRIHHVSLGKVDRTFP